MNLYQLLYPIRRWWWVLILTTLIAGVTSFLIVRDLPPIYEVRTTLMVGRTIENPNPNNNDFWLSQQLAATYASVALRDPVRNNTMAALGLAQLPEYQAQPVPNSQFLEITVVDTSPERAQAVANELANQLILHSPSGAEADNSDRQAFIEEQLRALQVDIAATNQEILDLQQSLGSLVSAVQIADAQQKLAALQDKLDTLQSNYVALLTNSSGGAINTLTVIEQAGLPFEPIGPNKVGIILLAAGIGLLLAASVAHVLELLDTTLRTPQDVERVLGVPVLGYIANMGKVKDPWSYVDRNPRTPVAEAFRALRTNLEFASAEDSLKTIFVASPETSEGKTTVATNLALVWAHAERKVALVDADLRQPKLHELTGLSLQPGLSEIFMGRIDLRDALRTWKDKNVSVLTAGVQQANLNELFASEKMVPIMNALDLAADIVLIDGPPFYMSDAMILAARADGVLLVVRHGQTRESDAQTMMEQIQRAGARVVGVVINGIPPRSAMAYGGYRFYSPRFASGSYFKQVDTAKRRTKTAQLNLSEAPPDSAVKT